MSDYLSTLFRLTETEDVLGPDEEDAFEAQSNARYEREKKFVEMLTQGCRKMGLSLRDGSHAVMYSEEDGEATIDVYEDVTLAQLRQFAAAGEVSVCASASYRDVLTIKIKTSDATVAESLNEAALKSRPTNTTVLYVDDGHGWRAHGIVNDGLGAYVKANLNIALSAEELNELSYGETLETGHISLAVRTFSALLPVGE